MISVMKHFLRGFLLGIVIAVSAVAARVDVTEEENGKDLLLKRGDLLVVHLPANPSTGYSWYLAVSAATESEALGVLKIPGDGVYEPVKSGTTVGSPVTSVWTLKALKPGGVRITFNYIRPWEKNVPPARTVSWPVTVRP
jgi:inhibitor of cysteine peptidase